MPLTRRSFCSAATAALLAPPPLFAQAPTTHPDVAALDRSRTLAEADAALAAVPTPLTSLPAARSPGAVHDFFSEAPEPVGRPGESPGSGARQEPFRAHADALLRLSLQVPALAAAAFLTAATEPSRSQKYAMHAAGHLRAWFVDAATAMSANLNFAELEPGTAKPRYQGILETTGLAEVAVAIPFLLPADAEQPVLTAAEQKQLRDWFASFLDWLTTSRLAALARDSKDHYGSSWLLQAASFARFTGNEALLTDLRHRFRSVTLRAQIRADGYFPHELSTPDPYRDSLFNLDLLAGAAHLLSTRFDSVWDYELQDGPGMRAAVARYVPYIADRNSWPYPADHSLFKQLPCRRPALLFAARAFDQPDYAALWRQLTPAVPPEPALLRAFPIRQPLLWVSRPRA